MSSIFTQRRSTEERQKAYATRFLNRIQEYMRRTGPENLDLSYAPQIPIPKGLRVRGILLLDNSQISSLPEGLIVDDSLSLLACENLTTLPAGLKVGTYLSALGAGIVTVSSNITIGTDAVFLNCRVASISGDISVGRNLLLGRNSPGANPIVDRYSKDELRSMLPGVKGKIKI